MSVFLKLLSTDHCTLCDKALNMLFSMPDIAGLELRVVDVVSDDGLLSAYGERVPVLQLFTAPTPEALATSPHLALEMAWPFTPDSIVAALQKLAT